MNTFEKWHNVGFFALMCLLVAGCNSEDEIQVVYRLDYFCSTETQQPRSEFILQCIANANPKSDEEPEDWITKCKDMAEATYCEERKFKVERFKPADGYWRDASKELATN